jgi:hypothetical protein
LSKESKEIPTRRLVEAELVRWRLGREGEEEEEETGERQVGLKEEEGEMEVEGMGEEDGKGGEEVDEETPQGQGIALNPLLTQTSGNIQRKLLK